MNPLSAAVLGCGNISDAYLSRGSEYACFEITSCADIDYDAAQAKADKYGIEAVRVEELLADPTVDVVINLTPPAAHVETCLQILDAGKHVFVEKPLAPSPEEATLILERAAEQGLRVGVGPDTILGPSLQACRQALDDGVIGEPIGATAVGLSAGHEHWHPNPDHFYSHGGGPLLDMGPYYLTALIFLLGSARSVTGSVKRTFSERSIPTDSQQGEAIEVEVPTHEIGIVDFEDGTIATVVSSFDVQDTASSSPLFEIYGTDGTLVLPNPNRYEGPVRVLGSESGEGEQLSPVDGYADGRGAGVADLVYSIQGNWEHRTSASLGRHVLDVLTAIRTASETGERVVIDSECEQPTSVPQTFPHGIGE